MKVNKDMFINSINSALTEDYSKLKDYKCKIINSSYLVDGKIFTDSDYVKQCQEKVEYYEQKVKDELERLKIFKTLSPEEIAMYLDSEEVINKVSEIKGQ